MNTTYDPRQDDPMHDDNITQEEFEQAATMKTITIEDPAQVKELLDLELGSNIGGHHPMFTRDGWRASHWTGSIEYVDGTGATAAELLADLKAKIAAHDPLAKLRKDAESHGYVLTKLPTD